jgi:hypothetical protein
MRLEAFRGLLRAVKLSEAQYAAECDRKVGADAQADGGKAPEVAGGQLGQQPEGGKAADAHAGEGGKAADAAPQHTRSRI